MTASWMDQAFEGAPVPLWLRRFEQEPVDALCDLMLGISALGHLAAADPEQLLLDWIEVLGNKADFRRRVDEAIAAWIERFWGDPLLGPPPSSAARTALAWCRIAAVVAAEPAFRLSAAALKAKVVGERHILGALTEGASRDPLGRAWLALARHQEDRSLAGEWWQLCQLPPNEPWHRGAYGIDGLRGLPPTREGEHRAGGFPIEVANGLLLLGDALARRADERWLAHKTARDEFLRTTRLTVAAYPMPEAWAGFWEEAVERPGGATVKTWLDAIMRASEIRKKPKRMAPPTIPYWRELAAPIAMQLAQGGPDLADSIAQAESLLHRQQVFAEHTGDGSYLARSACNFAGKVIAHNPELALSWLSLARRHDPWEAYIWTEETEILLAMGRVDDAIRVAWEATDRFPDDKVTYNTLANVLHIKGNLDDAEVQYRLTIRRFPDDVVAYAGLAEVLRAKGRLDDAEAQYRLTVDRFPKDGRARIGLANVRKPIKVVEAVVSPSSAPPKAILGDKTIDEPQTASARFTSAEIDTLLTDAGLLRRWARHLGFTSAQSTGEMRDRARALLLRLAAAEPYDARVAGERGLVALAEGDVNQAVALLREAVRRFPGSARVRYALAHAERRQAQLEERRLDPAKPEALVLPWKQLERIDPIYRPVHLLGAGRAWLAQVDGVTVEEGARKAFGQLGFVLHGYLVPKGEGRRDDTPEMLRERFMRSTEGFTSWWAREVQIHLFGATHVERAEDLESVDPIRERLATYSSVLDELEESWVSRHAAA